MKIDEIKIDEGNILIPHSSAANFCCNDSTDFRLWLCVIDGGLIDSVFKRRGIF